jgi:hypothetical protein
MLLRGPNLRWGILCNRYAGILYERYRLDLCPRLFVGRPSLELVQQGFDWRLTDFGLTLIGGFESASNLAARRAVPCSR